MNSDDTNLPALTPADWRVLVAALSFASDSHAARALALVIEQSNDPTIIKQALADPRNDPTFLTSFAEKLLRRNKKSEATQLLIPIAWNPSTPAELIDRLVATKDPDLTLAAALNPATSLPTLKRILVSAKHMDAVAAAVRHPALTADLLIAMLTHKNPSVADGAFAHPHTPTSAIMDVLGDDPDPVLWCAAARNPSIPGEVLADWVRHGRAAVRRITAANPSLPEAALADLVWSQGGRHQAQAARNPHISDELARYLTSPGYPEDTRFALAGNPHAPLDVAVALLIDPDPKVRAQVLRSRPDIPAGPLKEAASDEFNPRVMGAFAEHPNTPDHIIVRLVDRAGQHRATTLYAVASRPVPLSPYLISLLTAQARGSARDRFAARPECPHKLLTEIAHRGSHRSQCHAAVNPELPASVAASFRSPSAAVQVLLASR